MCCFSIILCMFSCIRGTTHPPLAWWCSRWNIGGHWNKRQREQAHTRHKSPSLTESWCRVICREGVGKEQVRNLRRRRDALFRIIGNWVIPIGLIGRGSTRRYRHYLSQVGWVLGSGSWSVLSGRKRRMTPDVHNWHASGRKAGDSF